jgi:hypothetical protein
VRSRGVPAVGRGLGCWIQGGLLVLVWPGSGRPRESSRVSHHLRRPLLAYRTCSTRLDRPLRALELVPSELLSPRCDATVGPL